MVLIGVISLVVLSIYHELNFKIPRLECLGHTEPSLRIVFGELSAIVQRKIKGSTCLHQHVNGYKSKLSYITLVEKCLSLF